MTNPLVKMYIEKYTTKIAHWYFGLDYNECNILAFQLSGNLPAEHPY